MAIKFVLAFCRRIAVFAVSLHVVLGECEFLYNAR